ARPGRLARTGVRPAALLGRRAEAGAGRRRRPAGRGAGRTGSAGLHRPADRARRCGALGQVRGRLPAADERRMIRLSTEPFEPGALLTSFAQGRSETGAVTTFTGIARAEKGGTQILELEAYPGFTEAEIGKIADRARTRWALDDLLIVHRIGQIAPGEPIVFVATASGHRRAAFEACDFLMDYLKSRAPF